MKQFLSLERLDVGRTLALTVGSPSVDRRSSKLKHIAFMLLFILGSLNVWAEETEYYSYTFSELQFSDNTTAATLGDITWTPATSWSVGTGYWGYGDKGQQWGSGSHTLNTMTLTAGTSIDNVSKIVVNAAIASSGGCNLSVKVGNTTVGNAQALATTSANYTFTCDEPLSGVVSIILSNGSKKKAQYIKSITIYTDESETPPTPSYTITAETNNSSYGTVELAGSVITASPKTGYTYANPAYSVSPDNSATVEQNGNEFTVTPSANTTVTINFEALPTYTVTLMDDNDELEQASAGANVVLPSRDGCEGYTFAGWTKTWTSAQSSWTTTAPEIINAGNYTPTANENLYPVYTKTEGQAEAWNKVTSAPEDWSGEYVIVNEDDEYAMTPSFYSGTSGEFLGAEVTITDGKVTNPTDAMIWTFAKNGANAQYSLQNKSTGTYANISGDGTTKAALSASAVWFTIASNTTEGVWDIVSVNYTGRGFAFYSSRNSFRTYAPSSNNTGHLYKKSGGSTTSYISEPDCSTPTPTPTCENTVSVTKVTPEHGAFEISATEVCGDGDGGEVTISNIEPATGYTLDEVSVTVGTYNESTGKVTGITDNTEIAVTFKELPKYTVSFETGTGNPGQAAITEGSYGAGITLPTGPEPKCKADGWIFAGWAEAAVASETTTAPTFLSGTYHPTADVTLHAVYKKTEGAVFDGTTEGDFAIYSIVGETKYYATAFAKKLGSTTNASEAVKFTFEKIVENEVTYFAIKSGNAYLSYKGSGTDFGFEGTEQYKWQPVEITGGWRLNSQTSGRAIIFSSTASPKVFGPYATSNLTNNSSDYHEIGLEGGTTYYLSAPACCEKKAITIASGIENGSVEADLAEACEGATVTLTFTPAGNHHLDSWSINGTAQDVAENTFTMPATAVTISATFVHDACENLAKPALNGEIAKTYNSATIAWGEVANASSYLVSVIKKDAEEPIFSGSVTELSKALSGLEAETQYNYSIMAVGDGVDYCAEGNTALEGNFTTAALPTVTLTLKVNGETDTEHSGARAILTPFNLPSTASVEDCPKVFVGWTATENYSSEDVAPEYAPGYEMTFAANAEALTLYAVFADVKTPGVDSYVKTALTDIASGSVVIITHDNGDLYAMSNDKGASAAPTAVPVTDTEGVLTEGVADNLLWTITKDGTDLSFAKGDDKLYCSSSNNSVRVGSGEANVFTIKDDYLHNTGNSAYVGVYNSADWRRYGTINSNIEGQTLAFYKKVSTAAVYENYSTACAATVADPEFSVEAGTYNEAKSVELTCATQGASIYYTTDGETTPTSASTLYESAITVDQNMTIKAIAIKGSLESQVVTAAYALKVATPTIEGETSFIGSTTVTLTCETEGATIWYSTDGFEPINEYEEPFVLTETTTIIAEARKTGWDYSSSVEQKFTKVDPLTVAEARAAIDAPGEETVSGQFVTGIISQVDSYNGTYHSITYWISADGTSTNALKVYSGLGIDGADFSSKDDVAVGDSVVIKGDLLLYNEVYEMNYNNYLVSYVAKELKSIAVKTAPTKVTYKEDDHFDPTGLVITAAYTVGQSQDIAYAGNKGDFSFAPALEDALETTDEAVTITYGGKTATQNITVNAKQNYIVTITTSENGEVVVKNGDDAIVSGVTEIVEGTTLTIYATPATDYAIDKIYVNGEEIEGNTFVLSAATTVNVTFKSQKAYTVSFSTGEGNSTVANVAEASYGAGIELPNGPETIACADWSFAGWAAAAVASETTEAPALLSGTYHPTDDVTLYAVYQKGGNVASDSKTFTFSEIASANNWENGEAYNATIAPVTVAHSNNGNNGKYYTSDASWRMYNGGTVTITAEGGSVTSVTSIPSQTFAISGGVATLECTATIKFTEIVVSYTAPSGNSYWSAPTCAEPQCESLEAPTLDGDVVVDQESAIIAWEGVENASSYVLNITQGETPVVENASIIDLSDLSYLAENLTANTTYHYTIMAVGNGTTYCAENNALLEGDFTTEAATPAPVSNTFELFSGALEEGDYVIYYDGKAMKNTVTNNRLDYLDVTPANDKINNPDASIIWHIAASGDYWTLYNAAVEKYAAGTAKNNAGLIANGTDDKALWTVTGSETYNFENKARAAGANPDNKWLRNNGTYGFACYASSTGGALSLYKKSESTAVVEKPAIAGEQNFLTTTTVTLSCETEGATIYYTTDGTDPKTSESKETYANPFELDATATVKAIANLGDDWSEVATKAFTKIDPMSVAEAIAAIPNTNDTEEGVYVLGYVCTAGTSVNNSGQMTYYISDNGTEDARLQVYLGKNIGNTAFVTTTDLALGDKVIVSGDLLNYKGAPEIKSGNYLISREAAAIAAPAFTPDGGGFMGETWVTITSATEGATVYYTLDGETPTNESLTEQPIALTATTTIKAIAIKDNKSSVVVAKTFTLSDPMTVVDAYDALVSEDLANVAVRGIVYQIDGISSGNATYWISDNGAEGEKVLEVFKGKGLNGADVVANAIQEGDEVVVFGTLTIYETNTSSVKEFKSGSRILSLSRADVVSVVVSGTPAKTEYKVGDAFAPAGLTVTATYENSAERTIDVANVEWEITPATFATAGTNQSVSVQATFNGVQSAAYEVSGLTVEEVVSFDDPNYEWIHITDASQLIEGKYYVIAENVKDKTVKNVLTSSYLEVTSTTFNEDKSVIDYDALGANTAVFKLGGSAGAWTLLEMTGENTGYLDGAGTQSLSWSGTAKTWPIAFSNGNVIIGSTESGEYRILYNQNQNNPRVKTYNSATSASMLLPQLYMWAPLSHKVTFDANTEAEVTNMPAAQRTYEGKIIIPAAVPAHSDVANVFDGWYLNAAGTGNKYVAGNEFATDEDVTLYAKWATVPTYTVSYSANGGIGDAPAEPQAAIKGASITVLENTGYTNPGYAFNGWTVTYNDGSEQIIDLDEEGKFEMPAYDVVIKATWAEQSKQKWALVKNVSELVAGNKYIIAAARDYNFALAEQKQNNRAATEVTKRDGNTPTLMGTNAMQIITLEGTTDAWEFNTGAAGYLYAANSDKNYLRTQETNDANGQWTITIDEEGVASITANGTYTHKVLQYNNSSKIFSCYANASQSAVALYTEIPMTEITEDTNQDAVPDGGDMVINENKTWTVSEDKEVGDLYMKDSAVIANSATVTVQDLYFSSKAGKSNQIKDASNLIVLGDFYYDFQLCDGDLDPDYWYSVAVPFDVDVNDGVYLKDGTKLAYRADFEVWEYDTEKRAQTMSNGWKRLTGNKMQAGYAYLIGFNPGTPNTIRFKAAQGWKDNLFDESEGTMALTGAEASDNTHSNWNGIANPTMHYTSVGLDVQVFDNNNHTFSPFGHTSYTFVVGTAFFVQATGSISLGNTDYGHYRAPQRAGEMYDYNVRISKVEGTSFDNQIIVRASEDANSEYTQGHDMLTMNNATSNTAALLWTENYNGKRLAIEEAPLVNSKAAYTLGVYAPEAGEYTIGVAAQKENADLYLTYNGRIIWNLAYGDYTASLQKGNNAGYGLVLKAKAPQVVTGTESVDAAEAGVQKLIINDHVYILRDEQMYDVTGKMVK